MDTIARRASSWLSFIQLCNYWNQSITALIQSDKVKSDSDFIKTNKFFSRNVHPLRSSWVLSHDYASSPGDTSRLQFNVLPRTHARLHFNVLRRTYRCRSMRVWWWPVVSWTLSGTEGCVSVGGGPAEEGCVCVAVWPVCDAGAAHNQVREQSQWNFMKRNTTMMIGQTVGN